MELLDCPIQPYAWGSRTALATLQGRPAPSEGPEAELWVGAHHRAPARLIGDGQSLLDVIAADPAGQLGPAVVDRFGPTLPFLLKILAAGRPLSLQAHPTRTQAEAGYAAEEAAGVPLDAPVRTYKDRWPKPELIVALTPFHALCGFREPAATADYLVALGVPALFGHAERLRSEGAGALPSVVADLLRLPAEARAGLVAGVGAAAARLAAAGHPDARWAAQLAAAYPGDAGVACALLVNVVELAPGEGIYLPAGNLHAYLAGTGVEVMANSDNVLRGGLTDKHVDVEELLRVLDFTTGPVPVLRPTRSGAEQCYPVPADAFRLGRYDLAGSQVRLSGGRPQVLLCTSGAVTARSTGARDGAPVEIGAGCAAYVPATDPPVVVAGTGTVFRAAPGI